VVQAFDVRERFFHFEFFLKEDGSWVALEVNMRPPGGWTTDIMNFSNDIDIYKGYADLMVHGHFPFTVSNPYHTAYIGRKERNYKYSHEEILQKFPTEIKHHNSTVGVFHAVMGHYGYLVRSEDLGHIEHMVQIIQQNEESDSNG